MSAGTRWVQKHRGEPDTQDRHAKLMTEQYVFSSAPVEDGALGCAVCCAALRCTHVMVDNPDIDVVYR